MSSFINLKDSDVGGCCDLSDLKNQVQAIEKIHATFQTREEITHVAFKPYISEVLSNVFEASGGNPVNTRIEIPDFSVRTNVAVTIGLMINETATNAFKHGFRTADDARFTVTLDESVDADDYILTVSNNGTSLPEEFDIKGSESLGMTIINALVSQLRGELSVHREQATAFAIRFPKTVV